MFKIINGFFLIERADQESVTKPCVVAIDNVLNSINNCAISLTRFNILVAIYYICSMCSFDHDIVHICWVEWTCLTENVEMSDLLKKFL